MVRHEPWQQRERRLRCRGLIGVDAQRLKHGAVLSRAQLACKILLLLGSQRRSSPQCGEELRCHLSHDAIGALPFFRLPHSQHAQLDTGLLHHAQGIFVVHGEKAVGRPRRELVARPQLLERPLEPHDRLAGLHRSERDSCAAIIRQADDVGFGFVARTINDTHAFPLNNARRQLGCRRRR